VFIDDVLNGQKCGCICSKCREPLIAKNGGEIMAHHFAHRTDSNCRGESLAHMEAKEIIKNHKYLFVPDPKERYGGYGLPLVKVNFETVKLEQLIGDSNYRADLIGIIKGKQVIIEIEATHELGWEKERFIRDNKLTTLCIDLSKEIEDFNSLPDNFNKVVMEKSPRNWVYNEKQEAYQKDLEKFYDDNPDRLHIHEWFKEYKNKS
jgi:hypothetical protein